MKTQTKYPKKVYYNERTKNYFPAIYRGNSIIGLDFQNPLNEIDLDKYEKVDEHSSLDVYYLKEEFSNSLQPQSPSIDGEWKSESNPFYNYPDDVRFSINNPNAKENQVRTPVIVFGKTYAEAESNKNKVEKSVNMHNEFVRFSKEIVKYYNDNFKEVPVGMIPYISQIEKLLEQA